MNWNLFKDHFHPSWWKKMKPWIESDECNEIYRFLKSESQRGVKLTPLSNSVYNCFLKCSYDDLKLVICGTAPYSFIKDDNILVADGLLLGCSNTNYVHPHLYQFYNAIEKELFDGLNLNYIKNPDISYLAEEGVLMLNSALTTEIGKENAHKELWKPFMKYLFEEILIGTNVPVLFLGENDIKKYTKNYSCVFSTSKHPSSVTEWESEGMFTKINKILLDGNWYSVNWLNIEKSPF